MLTIEQKKRKAEYHKEWVRKNRKKLREYQRQWALIHVEAIKKQMRKTHQKYKEKYKERYEEKKKLWRTTHREHIAEHTREYRKTPKGRENVRKAIKKYADNHPERINAWLKAYKIPIRPCEICGSDKRIHRHHPDINKPLEVVMLCPLHHKQAHLNVL